MATVKAAPPISVPSVMPMEEGFWQPIPKAARHECELKPLFDACTEYSSTQTSCSRTRWSSMWPKLKQIMIEQFSHVQDWNFGTWLKMLTRASKQDATHAKNFNTWDQYKVTVAQEKLSQKSLHYFDNSYLSHRIFTQSQFIARRGLSASSQRIIHCPKQAMSTHVPRWWASIEKNQILIRTRSRNDILSKPANLRLFCLTPKVVKFKGNKS